MKPALPAKNQEKDITRKENYGPRVLRKRHARSVNTETAEARRTTILQPVERKPHSQKERQNEKAEDYVPDEGTNPQ